METSTVVALVIVALVIGGALYIGTRPATGAGGLALGDGNVQGGQLSEGAQYITAGGGAINAVLQGVGSLYGAANATNRQAGGTSAGAK